MVSRAQSFGYWVLMGLLLWPLLHTFGPQLEGRLNPVVVSTHLTRVLPGDDNHALIYGDSKKVRDCSFHRIEWFYGEPGERSVLLPLEVMERFKLRDAGEFSFGPWKLNLNADLVRSESYAVVYHRCHPFWLTQTAFWP